MKELANLLRRLDGQGYNAYKDLEALYHHRDYLFFIDHVQGDPFAAPSRMRIEMPRTTTGIPPWATTSRSRRIAAEDYLLREFSRNCRTVPKGQRGTGKGGLFSADSPAQEVLERSACTISDETVEVRFTAGLPAFGRKIAGRDAQAMLLEELPRIIEESLLLKNLNQEELRRHVEACEDADAVRAMLPQLGCIAFVADGAVLPRKAGSTNCR